jgi:hypothetical protein
VKRSIALAAVAVGILVVRKRRAATTSGEDARPIEPPPTDAPQPAMAEPSGSPSSPAPTVVDVRGGKEDVDPGHPLSMLTQDHRAILATVTEVRSANPSKPLDNRELHAAVQRLVSDASRHEVAEETYICRWCGRGSPKEMLSLMPPARMSSS